MIQLCEEGNLKYMVASKSSGTEVYTLTLCQLG